MKKLTKKQKQQIEALATLADYITNKDVLDKKEITEIENRLDRVIASVDSNSKFFKRLL